MDILHLALGISISLDIGTASTLIKASTSIYVLRQMLDIIPDAGHSLEVLRDLDTVPGFLGVVPRRNMLHLVRQRRAERHRMRWAGFSVDVEGNLPLQRIVA